MYHTWIKGKWSSGYLGLVCAIALIGLWLVEHTKTQQRYPAFERQIQAARLMQASLEAVKEYRLTHNLPINSELDPNATGMIGKEVTAITTTLGNLEAKRTSTNPAFAALLIKYFTEAGLQRGDVVAIGASGSFPALILATLAATKVMELEPLLIYSFGSSTYGANIPEFTFFEMLALLNKQELLPYQTIAVSLGGRFDKAEDLLFQDSNDIFFQLTRSAGVPFIYEEDLGDNICKRVQVIEEHANGRPITCFVNIGGASANFGVTPASLNFPSGLVKSPRQSGNLSEKGLIFTFARRGIPVIHLLNVKSLAIKNGLPIDPAPFPRIGEGGVYYTIAYNNVIILLALGLDAVLLLKPLRKAC